MGERRRGTKTVRWVKGGDADQSSGTRRRFSVLQKWKTSDDTFNEMALLFELKQYGTSAWQGCILSSNYEAHKIAFRLDIMLRFVTGKLHRENLRAVPS